VLAVGLLVAGGELWRVVEQVFQILRAGHLQFGGVHHGDWRQRQEATVGRARTGDDDLILFRFAGAAASSCALAMPATSRRTALVIALFSFSLCCLLFGLSPSDGSTDGREVGARASIRIRSTI
jgi:hypothetical protein